MVAMVIAPIVVGVGLLAATAGWYMTVQRANGVATGPALTVAFVPAPGCPVDDAPTVRDRLKARMDDLGLAPSLVATTDGTWTFTLRTPGVLPDEREHLPNALAAQGRLVVHKDGTPLSLTPKDVGFQLAFSGTPITLIVYPEPLPERGLTVTLDDAPMDVEQASGVELQLAARAGDSVSAVRAGTERTVVVRHPLPCPVRATIVDG
jgi:hypothetical protein